MGQLRNPFHDAVARRLAKREPGTTQADAVRSVCEEFGRPAMKPANARKLCQRPDIAARVAELNAIAASDDIEETVATIKRVNIELGRVGFHNPKHVYEHDQKGRIRLRDLLSLPDSVAAAISSVEQDDKGVTKLKFHNKVAALSQLSKNLGIAETVQIAGKLDVGDLTGLTDDQLGTLETIIRSALVARGDTGGSGSAGAGAKRAETQ